MWISLPHSINGGALAHYSAADFVRALIGMAVCLFVAVQVFRRPQDDEGYRAWVYIGLALVAVLILVVAMESELPT